MCKQCNDEYVFHPAVQNGQNLVAPVTPREVNGISPNNNLSKKTLTESYNTWLQTTFSDYQKRSKSDKKFDFLTYRLQKSLEYNHRDNYTLMQISKVVCNIYNYHQDYLQDGMFNNLLPVKLDKHYKPTGEVKEISFKRQNFCKNIKELLSTLITTEHGIQNKGIASCGNVHTCPACATKIEMKRKNEVDTIIENCELENKKTVLVTLTAPHYRYMSLNQFGSLFSQAWYTMTRMLEYRHYFHPKTLEEEFLYSETPELFDYLAEKSIIELRRKNNKIYKKTYDQQIAELLNAYLKDYKHRTHKIFGYIKNYEYMLNHDNGTHKHSHIIFIFDSLLSESDVARAMSVLKRCWKSACQKVGLVNDQNENDFDNHGFSYQTHYDTDYINKQSDDWFATRPEQRKVRDSQTGWGISTELTMSNIKVAHSVKTGDSPARHGYSPFALLAKIAIDDMHDSAMRWQDIRLFLEYACYTFGESAVQYSRGLRAWAGLEEKTDAQLAEEQTDTEMTIIGGVTRQQWSVICRNSLILEYRKAAKNFGASGVNHLLKSLDLPPLESKEVCQLYDSSGESDRYAYSALLRRLRALPYDSLYCGSRKEQTVAITELIKSSPADAVDPGPTIEQISLF